MRISGKSFTINLGDIKVLANTFTLDIDDSGTVAKDQGIPNGWVDGEVAASGEIELDAMNLKLLIDAASRAGSFRGLDPFDINAYADTGKELLRVEAFGCQFRIASLLDIDTAGGEKHLTTLPYDVTSPDFVRINGVPYLRRDETEAIRA